jgi:putative transcriptional regulator
MTIKTPSARPRKPAPMTEKEIEADALADQDDPPMTDHDLAAAPRTPRIRIMRRALRLTQEEFAERYMIPLGTLRAWEQGVSLPDKTAQAYLRAIRGNAEAVAAALHAQPAAAE